MSDHRIPHWKYLENRISKLIGTPPERAFAIDTLLFETAAVIIPEQHCSEILAAIDERLVALAGGFPSVLTDLRTMRENVEVQVTNYAAKKAEPALSET